MSKNVTSAHPSTTVIIDNDVEDSDSDDDEYFMRKSLEVAQRALEIGEVPVGCVIVLDKDHPAVLSKKKYNHLDNINTDNGTNSIPRERRGVIISHGANQVNATRDATRHAEIVAIDRLLTDGVSSDQLRLPQAVDRKSNNNAEKNNDSSVGCKKRRHSTVTCGQNEFEDRLLNVPSHPGHWANLFGWGNNFVLQSKKSDDGNMDEDLKVISSSLRSKDIFRHCQLYVTCEVSNTVSLFSNINQSPMIFVDSHYDFKKSVLFIFYNSLASCVLLLLQWWEYEESFLDVRTSALEEMVRSYIYMKLKAAMKLVSLQLVIMQISILP